MAAATAHHLIITLIVLSFSSFFQQFGFYVAPDGKGPYHDAEKKDRGDHSGSFIAFSIPFHTFAMRSSRSRRRSSIISRSSGPSRGAKALALYALSYSRVGGYSFSLKYTTSSICMLPTTVTSSPISGASHPCGAGVRAEKSFDMQKTFIILDLAAMDYLEGLLQCFLFDKPPLK